MFSGIKRLNHNLVCKFVYNNKVHAQSGLLYKDFIFGIIHADQFQCRYDGNDTRRHGGMKDCLKSAKKFMQIFSICL